MIAAFFWLCLKASLLSSGGLGNLPSLHQDLTGLHWANSGDFAHAVAIGQFAPGPTGLWTIALGYLVAGLAGALAAALAVSLPPQLVLVFDRAYHYGGAHPAVAGFVRGITLVVAVVVPVVLLKVLANTGFDLRSGLLAAGALVGAGSRRVPPAVLLAAAAVAGFVLYR